jgi:hypothetical protein
MIDPVSGKVERKILFFQKIGGDVCGVGTYNPHPQCDKPQRQSAE